MEVLDEIEVITKNKRDLLPIWIKIFLWIFLVMACFMPVVFILGLFDFSTSIGIYGFTSDTMFSALGFIITGLIMYKGVIAYGLWTEKKWAVTHAINDAIIGIIACALAMIIPLVTNYGFRFTYRLELIALVPYLFKMKWIKNEWNDEIPIETIKNDDIQDEEHNEEEKEENTEKQVLIKEIIYTTHTYNCEDGVLTIEQEFQNPNVGEKVFLNDKAAPFGKYKLGFMSHIFVDKGVIDKITNF